MAHSAVWGHSPIQRQNTNSKKSTIKSCLRALPEGIQNFVKLIQTMNENKTFVDFAFYVGCQDLIQVMSSAEIELGPK